MTTSVKLLPATLRYVFFAFVAFLWVVSSGLADQTSDIGDRFERLWAPTDNKWVSYGQGDTRASNQSVNSGGQLMTPLWQDESSLLFGDFRGRTNDHSGIEGNFGIGYRQINSHGWIVGGSAFYDLRRSNFGNTFQQATLGIEAMSLQWDARFNGYIPDGKAYNMASGVGVGPATPVLNGNQLALSYSGALIERSYYGFDGEVGYLLASNNSGNAELRGFAGGYNFATTDSRFPEIIGPRVRLEGRLYDLGWLLGNGSRLVAGFEYQYDRIRESQYIGLVQVRIPLGRSTRSLTRLERRMLDTVVRDIDVVSQADLVNTNQVTYEAAQIRSPIDGQWGQVGPVAQANGSSNLSQIVANLGSNSTVFVDGSGGPLTVTNPIVMNDNQRMFGGGETLQLRSETTHQEYNYVVPGTQPTLIAASSSTNVIVVGNNDWVSGFTIQGGNSAITSGTAALPNGNGFADVDRLVIQDTQISGANIGVAVGNLTNSLIENVDSSGNTSFGFVVNGLTNSTMRGNLASDEVVGFSISGDVSHNSTFYDNYASQNALQGYVFYGNFDGRFVNNVASDNSDVGAQWWSPLTGSVRNNIAVGNGSDGFQFQQGMTSLSHFNGNLSLQNAGSGLYSTSVSGTFYDNTAYGNGLEGFYVGNVTSTGIVDGNLSQNNGLNGIYGTFMDGKFTNNIANDNSNSGISFIDRVGGLVENNLAQDNVGHGFYLNSLSSTAIIRNNTAIGNTSGFTGVAFNGYSDNAGLVTGNLASDNATTGFWWAQTLTGTMSGNTATNNGTDGFRLDGGIGSTGQLIGNSSTNNSGQGYAIGPNSGTATANTGSGNAGGQDVYP